MRTFLSVCHSRTPGESLCPALSTGKENPLSLTDTELTDETVLTNRHQINPSLREKRTASRMPGQLFLRNISFRASTLPSAEAESIQIRVPPASRTPRSRLAIHGADAPFSSIA